LGPLHPLVGETLKLPQPGGQRTALIAELPA